MFSSTLLVLRCTILVVACCLTASIVQAQYGYYTIIAPGTVRSNSFYHLSVSLSEYEETCIFELSVDCSNNKYSTTVHIEPGTINRTKIWIPRLTSSTGLLRVNGLKGITITQSGLLHVEAPSYSVFLQTDKSKYRPGELMQFRVICVDRLTQPADVADDVDVEIYDGDENLIKVYPKIKVVQGVFKTNLQLSEYPVLGEWKIIVKSNGLSVAEKQFQVARYVLPNFAVQANTRSDIALRDGRIELNVTAKYTYDEPVHGNMTLHAWSRYSIIEDSHWMTTKTFPINGSAKIILDFKTDLGIPTENEQPTLLLLYKLAVAIVVRDHLTNQTSSTLENINIYNKPFKVSVDVPKYYEDGKPVQLKISVKDLMGNPVRDKKNPVTLVIESDETEPLTYSLYLNAEGMNVLKLNLKSSNIKDLRFSAIYQDCHSTVEKIQSPFMTAFTLTTLTDSPQVGDELVIQLKSIDPIQTFVYELVSRGDIIETKQVNVPDNATTYLLRLNATHEMVPKTTLFVHRTLNGTFDSKLKDIYIKRAFRNSITLSTDHDAHPGDLVTVNVTTDPVSYVGLMGIDRKLFIDPNYKEDLTEDNIFTELRNYDSINMDGVVYPGSEAGLITFSNAKNRRGGLIGKIFAYEITAQAERPQPLPRAFDKPSIELPYVRKIFSESWLFTDIAKTPEKEFTVSEKIPDTITSWAISGFSLNPTTGLTLTKNTTNVKVFQELFISMELPHAVREGEILEIQVFVFNYMNKTLQVDITIENSGGHLELLDNITTSSDVQLNRTIMKTIQSKGRERLSFLVKTPEVGKHNVTVKAISSLASDAIQKTLNVEPAGIPHSVSQTYLVHFLDDSKQEDQIDIDIPENRVPNSELIHLYIVGDIFGPLIRSLEKNARVPHGNGRENMDYFMSNLLMLKYLKTLNQTNPMLENKARLYLELGYQNQLAFKQLDGSFSMIIQPKERTGDLWLTVYTLWGFEEASKYISVDQERIRRGLEYLTSKQDESGSFKAGGSPKENVALTSFATLYLSINATHAKQYRQVIDKALEYIFDALDDLEDLNSVAMPTYALVVGGHNQSTEILQKLSASESLTSKAVMWTKPDSLQSSLETTAAGFMNLLESQHVRQNLLPVVRALTSVGQNEKTPAHIIALNALIEFAEEINVGTKDLMIHFDDYKGTTGNYHIDSQNSEVLETIQLRKDSRKIRLSTEGKGFAIANIVYKYNLPPANQTSFDYQANITIKESNDVLMVLDICLAMLSHENHSNLTKVEVHLQSGYTTNEDAFNDILQSNKFVQVIRLNEREDWVLMYLEDIPESGTCLQLTAWKMFSVFNAKPASMIVYDALGNGQQSVSFYSN